MQLADLCTESLLELLFELKHFYPQFFIASLNFSFNSRNASLVCVPNDLKLGFMGVDVLVVVLIRVDYQFEGVDQANWNVLPFIRFDLA